MIKQFSYLSLLAFLTSTVGLAAPVASHTHIHDDSRELLSKTYHLGAVTRGKTGYSHLTVDVFKFRNTLQRFTRTMHGPNPSYEHIRDDFARVTQAHEHLASVYRRAHGTHHDRHIARDYNSIAKGYQHLENMVSAHLKRPRPDHHHNTRSGY